MFELPEFKIGNWVTLKATGSQFKVAKISLISGSYFFHLAGRDGGFAASELELFMEGAK